MRTVYRPATNNNPQLLPLCEGDMTICSPEAGNIARGRSKSMHVSDISKCPGYTHPNC